MKKVWPIVLLYAFLSLVFLMLLYCTGCAPGVHNSIPNSIPASTGAADGAMDLNRFADVAIDKADPWTSAKGKPWLEVAKESLAVQWKKLLAVKSINEDVQAESNARDLRIFATEKERDMAREKYSAVYHSVGYTAQRWLVYIFWAWMVAGFVSIILMIFNPFGFGRSIGSQILKLLPLSNGFYFIEKRVTP